MNTNKVFDDINEIYFVIMVWCILFKSPFLIKIHTEICTMRYVWELLPNNLEVGMDGSVDETRIVIY